MSESDFMIEWVDFSFLAIGEPETSSKLNIACMENDVDEVRRLIDEGMDPNCGDNRGWCAVHQAAVHHAADNDSHETLEFLLSHKDVLPLRETPKGLTALYLAVANKSSLRIVDLLLEKVEGIAEYASNKMTTPLHLAVDQGRMEIIESLIRAGAPLDIQDRHGETPLHKAVLGNHASVLAVLLHAGADPSPRNRDGMSPFLLACHESTFECVNEIFPFVHDINECNPKGDSALMLAIQKKCVETVKFLLANGANPLIENRDDMLPLYMALVYPNSEIFQILLSVTDFNIITRTTFNLASKPWHFPRANLKLLLESDLNPECFNEPTEFDLNLSDDRRVLGVKLWYVESPPICALLYVMEYIYLLTSPELSETLLYLLLTKGVAVNSLYENECPPLVYLLYWHHINCHPMVIDILLKQGCNVDYRSSSRNDKLQIPDAIIASISSSGTTLPLLLCHSLKVDPEEIVTILVEHSMIGQKISPEILKNILPHCCLPMSVLDNLKKCLQPYFPFMKEELLAEFNYLLKPSCPSLRHLSRRAFRFGLRRKDLSTQQFFHVLEKLPIPTKTKKYLRFIEN